MSLLSAVDDGLSDGATVDTRVSVPAVAVFTGGGDSHYAIPLVCSLSRPGMRIDVIGSDEFDSAPLRGATNVVLHKLHTANRSGDRLGVKLRRLIATYIGIATYAARTDARIFHILWLNRVVVDRLLLVAYFKLLGKTLVFTAHNIDIGERDGRASLLGRCTLRFMYNCMDHIFVHTEKMKLQLEQDFHVPPGNVTVIPFGLNTVIPESQLSREAARKRLGIGPDERILLFFGNITPYKGVEYLVQALAILIRRGLAARLIVAGRVKDRHSADYHAAVEKLIDELAIASSIVAKSEFIPDDEVGVYFNAADVCVLPYTIVFQSGVLVLSYGFGCPVVATDVGSVRDDVIEGRTGFLCRPKDPAHLAESLARYFDSDLCRNPVRTREDIRRFARGKYSWEPIASVTMSVYSTISRHAREASSLSQPTLGGTP
jgi:D-inositol-3-phosphate glycosyltransferase